MFKYASYFYFALTSMGLWAKVPAPTRTPIKILTWYDYFTQAQINELEALDLEPHYLYYKTSEQAMQLFFAHKDSIDLAILPNIAAMKLQQFAHQNAFAGLDRAYPKMFKEQAATLLPMSWFSSVYAVDTRYVKNVAPDIQSYLALEKQDYTVTITDDVYEVYQRLLLDAGYSHLPNSKKLGAALAKLPPVQHRHFLTSVTADLLKPKQAVFGCVGEIAPVLAQAPWLKLQLPKQTPVIGYDSVCVVHPNPKLGLAGAVAAAKAISERKIVLEATRANSYFSPWLEDIASPYSQIRAIHSALAKRIHNGQYMTHWQIHEAEQKVLNTWWQQVRYEQKVRHEVVPKT